LTERKLTILVLAAVDTVDDAEWWCYRLIISKQMNYWRSVSCMSSLCWAEHCLAVHGRSLPRDETSAPVAVQIWTSQNEQQVTLINQRVIVRCRTEPW